MLDALVAGATDPNVLAESAAAVELLCPTVGIGIPVLDGDAGQSGRSQQRNGRRDPRRDRGLLLSAASPCGRDGVAVGALHHKNRELNDADKARLMVEPNEDKAAVGAMAHSDSGPETSRAPAAPAATCPCRRKA